MFKYADYYGTGSLVSLPASMDSYINRGSTGTGALVSGVATIANRGWMLEPTESDDWTCQDDASDTWTDESTITDTWINV
jgi:hypothetical protein